MHEVIINLIQAQPVILDLPSVVIPAGVLGGAPPVAMALAVARAPIVTGIRHANVAVVRAMAQGVSYPAAVVGTQGASGNVAAALAGASASALPPAVAATRDATVTAPIATATGTAYAPGVGTSLSVTSFATLSSATANARVPAVAGGAIVTAVAATATGSARPAVVTGSPATSVAAVVATASATARAPVVIGDARVNAVVATATSDALDPANPIVANVSAVKASATTRAPIPIVSGETVLIGGGPAIGQARAFPPTISNTSTIASLIDNFNSGTPVPALRIQGGNVALVTAFNGGMKIAHPATAQPDFNRIETVGTHNLTGSSVYVRVDDYGNQGLPNHHVMFRLNYLGDISNMLQFFINNGSLIMQQYVNGSSTIPATLSLDVDAHKWLRLREAGGTVFWDTSRNGVVWTNRASLVTPLNVTAFQLVLLCGDDTAEAASFAVFDNLNINPSMAALIDNFDSGTPIAALSTAGFNTALITASGGGMQIAHDATAQVNFNKIYSTGVYDLRDSYVYVAVTNYGNTALANHEVSLQLTYLLDATNFLEFGSQGNVLFMTKRVAGVTTIVSSVALNTTNHKWLRIREQAGTVFWDVSANGLTWTNLTSTATPISAGALQLILQCGDSVAEGASFAVFDQLNS